MDTRLAPESIDDTPLSEDQREQVVDLIAMLVTQAGHTVADAARLAERVFAERLFRKQGGRWVAREVVELGDAHGRIMRGPHWRREQTK